MEIHILLQYQVITIPVCIEPLGEINKLLLSLLDDASLTLNWNKPCCPSQEHALYPETLKEGQLEGSRRWGACGGGLQPWTCAAPAEVNIAPHHGYDTVLMGFRSRRLRTKLDHRY